MCYSFWFKRKTVSPQKKKVFQFSWYKSCVYVHKICYVYWSKNLWMYLNQKTFFLPLLFSSLYGYLSIFCVFCTKDSGKVIFYPVNLLSNHFQIVICNILFAQHNRGIYLYLCERCVCWAAREIKIWKIKWLLIVRLVWDGE